jgi:hypothetical protein
LGGAYEIVPVFTPPSFSVPMQGDPHLALRVSQVLAACGLLVLCAVFQPKHKEVELFQRRAAVQALKADTFKNRATLQVLTADAAAADQMDDDENAPAPEDIMAIQERLTYLHPGVSVNAFSNYSLCVNLQGAQAGSILGLDYMEASAAAGAAAAAAAGPELIPLLALRQRYNVPVTHPKTKHQKLRTVDAPFRLSGFVVHPRDAAQPSADPWTGNPTLTSVPLSANESPGGGRNPAPGAAESDYGAARSAAQSAAQQTWQRSARTTRSKMSAKEGAKRQRSARTTRSKMHGGKRGTNFKRHAKAAGRGKK